MLLETSKTVEELRNGMVDVAAKSGQILSLSQSVESSLHSMRAADTKLSSFQQAGTLQEAGGVFQ